MLILEELVDSSPWLPSLGVTVEVGNVRLKRA